MPKNPNENDKHIWDYKMNELLKIGCKLQGNLCNLFTVLMDLCDIEVKNHVKALLSFKDFDKLDSMTLMKAIKKIVYTGGGDNLHAKHIKAMEHIVCMGIYQENSKRYRISTTNTLLYARFVLNCA